MEDDDVGYRKPPKRSRFKKGRSGNPNGRPKGMADFGTKLFRELRSTIAITENGKRSKITKLDAMFKQLANRAASGDHRAAKTVIELISAFDSSGLQPQIKIVMSKAEMEV
jgi:hypothetical protein